MDSASCALSSFIRKSALVPPPCPDSTSRVPHLSVFVVVQCPLGEFGERFRTPRAEFAPIEVLDTMFFETLDLWNDHRAVRRSIPSALCFGNRHLPRLSSCRWPSFGTDESVTLGLESHSAGSSCATIFVPWWGGPSAARSCSASTISSVRLLSPARYNMTSQGFDLLLMSPSQPSFLREPRVSAGEAKSLVPTCHPGSQVRRDTVGQRNLVHEYDASRVSFQP